jgi:hypothetical protein
MQVDKTSGMCSENGMGPLGGIMGVLWGYYGGIMWVLWGPNKTDGTAWGPRAPVGDPNGQNEFIWFLICLNNE